MTHNDQRIEIAIACGATVDEVHGFLLATNCDRTVSTYWPEKKIYLFIPDYTNDLNAMYEAAIILRKKDGKAYIRYQLELIGQDGLYYIDSSAASRAEAFLRAINKWVE